MTIEQAIDKVRARLDQLVVGNDSRDFVEPCIKAYKRVIDLYDRGKPGEAITALSKHERKMRDQFAPVLPTCLFDSQTLAELALAGVKATLTDPRPPGSVGELQKMLRDKQTELDEAYKLNAAEKKRLGETIAIAREVQDERDRLRAMIPPQATAVELPLDALRTDGGTQLRVALNEARASQYRDALDDGATFEAVVAYHDGADHWLADGFHRLEAHRLAGRETIAVEVRQGSRRDAILHSAGANGKHGLDRTNEDKRRAVETLLRDEEWSAWSDREIARRCNVGNRLVGDVRRELSVSRTQMRDHGESPVNGEQTEPVPAATPAPRERKVERNGTTYVMNTEGIGNRKPATQEEPPPEPEPTQTTLSVASVVATEMKETETPDQEESKPLPEIEGVGIIEADNAINCLIRIPKNDAFRRRGLQAVADWIRSNQ